jgi:hypothetical protein
MPVLSVEVDGRQVHSLPALPEYHDLGVALPVAEQTGASLVLTVAPTFVPGGSDKRTLGVQIDRLVCRPLSGPVRPPSNALSQATLAAVIFAAGLGLLGLSLSSAMFTAAVVALGQTLMLAIASGAYSTYPGRLPGLALGIVVPMILLARGIERWRGKPLSSSARFVLAATASVLFLKLAGLYHPSKPIIDAVFHAHRFDGVLAGLMALASGAPAGDFLFFWQPMPDGVRFPYAIGLYVFAAPWAWMTTDHVALVRTVAATTDALAAAVLYPVIVRAWGDRRVAALAAVIFQLIPLGFPVLGNANLTNLFGTSMALVTMAAAVTWRLDPARFGSLAAFTLLTAWALGSHVSTVTMLTAILGLLFVLYLWQGDAERRRAAWAIAIAGLVAAALVWIAYYRHFMDLYRTAFSRMFGEPAAVASEVTLNAAEVIKGNMTMSERVVDLFRQMGIDAGVPLLILAAIGAWTLWRRGSRDRLTSALLAWAGMWLVFSLSTVFAQVGDAYVRYAAEFIGRINLATAPLLAVLAARGAACGWDANTPAAWRRPSQITALLLIAWALSLAINGWVGWFSR